MRTTPEMNSLNRDNFSQLHFNVIGQVVFYISANKLVIREQYGKEK